MGAAFLIPLALSAASEGLNYANQSQAQSRQNTADVQDLIAQQQLQNQGAGAVSKMTQQIAKSNPQALQQAATESYVAQLRNNAAGSMLGGNTAGATTAGAPTSAVASPAVAGADPRYAQNLSQDQQQVENYGNTYANEMGNIDAAVRQRQNEGLGLETLGTNLGLLNAQSYGQNFVDNLRAQAAGQQNPYMAVLSSALGKGAQAYAMNAGGGTSGNPMGTPYDMDQIEAQEANPAMQPIYQSAWGS